MTCKLLLATNNKGKIAEFRALLKGVNFELVTPADLDIRTTVEETGGSYEENARLKAMALARESGLVSLGDDSGLEVDALDREPGVMSARYAGDRASDSDRVNYLLAKLKDVPWDNRTARFRCVIALAAPSGEIAICEGECSGIITFEARGKSGFGYDPVFYFPDLGKTMAELGPEIKNRISHRATAAARARDILTRPPFACE